MITRLPPGAFFGQSRGRFEVAGLTFAESAYTAGFDIPAHAHAHAFFYLVIEGTCEETARHGTSTCGPSTLVFHPSGEPHANRWPGAGGRAFHIEISQTRADNIREHSVVLDDRNEFRGSMAPWLAMRLYREYCRPDGASLLALEGMALEVLAEASRRKVPAPERTAPRWLNQARELLHDRFAEDLPLGIIAATVGVHPVHLARTFGREFGCSPGEYLRRLRIEITCQRLAMTDAPLAEIALAAGFSDQSHFTKTFRHFNGMTPGEYRRRLRSR
ncbi:AraC family transcriptional regulator [Singulisphaera sp. GP187]|uniref:AraC family transcriptional regulator n=1 Tax=Singulisphaera sp. GP187 TaxID=1882752 RepID=UPI0009419E9C|nr:AraC family transcriptional regulator [Singulisphaera sp. GP187]